MPRLQTAYFGEIDFAESAVFRFPHGVPGFEDETAFVFLHKPQTEPLMFMQSLLRPAVCFIVLPILVADPHYRVSLAAEDLAELHLPADRQPRIGEDILCAAVVRAGDAGQTEPTANLMAPVVVNLKERIGLQAIQTDPSYSYRHPLSIGQERVPC